MNGLRIPLRHGGKFHRWENPRASKMRTGLFLLRKSRLEDDLQQDVGGFQFSIFFFFL